MKEEKYNFDIVFQKFEELKEEQGHIKDTDFINSKEIHKQIKELKEYYDNSLQELETYTRS